MTAVGGEGFPILSCLVKSGKDALVILERERLHQEKEERKLAKVVDHQQCLRPSLLCSGFGLKEKLRGILENTFWCLPHKLKA